MAPGPGVESPVGAFHFWLEAPVQVQICSRMPFADPAEHEKGAPHLVLVEDVEQPVGVGDDATLHRVP